MVSSQMSSFAWVMKGPSTAEVSREAKKGPIFVSVGDGKEGSGDGSLRPKRTTYETLSASCKRVLDARVSYEALPNDAAGLIHAVCATRRFSTSPLSFLAKKTA
jgi:hypothetical protein